MDYYGDSHEDPYYHRSGGGAPPMPLFASAGRGDPRERSSYYEREAAPMGKLCLLFFQNYKNLLPVKIPGSSTIRVFIY